MNKLIPKVKKNHWLLGNLSLIREDSLKFYEESIKEYGDIFQFKILSKRYVFINKPEYVQHILQKNDKKYNRHKGLIPLKDIVGNALAVSDGENWKRKRRLITPEFHKKKVESYFDLIQNHIETKIKAWNASSKEVWLFQELTDATLGIISDFVVGKEIENSKQILEENLMKAFEIAYKRMKIPMPKWFPKADNKEFLGYIRNLQSMIDKVIQEKESKEIISDDFVSMLLLTSKETDKIQKKEILGETLSLILAGHETTSIALFRAISFVMNDSEILEKLAQEFDDVTKGEKLRLEHLQDLKYTAKVIDESLRLSSVIWTIAREAKEDDNIDGYPIKKGDSIMISPYTMHRNEKYWKNPYAFNPERFDNRVEHRYSFIPFGAGPKVCLGATLSIMEMKIIIYHIITSQYKVLETNDIDFYQTITLRPKTDVLITKSEIKTQKMKKEIIYN